MARFAGVEGDRPIRAVVANGCGNGETFRLFRIDLRLGIGVELLGELPPHFGVGEDVVVIMVFRREGGAAVVFVFDRGENGGILTTADGIVGQVLDDQREGARNEGLGIGFELPDEWPSELNAASRRKFIDVARLASRHLDVMEIVNVLHAAAMRATSPQKKAE